MSKSAGQSGSAAQNEKTVGAGKAASTPVVEAPPEDKLVAIGIRMTKAQHKMLKAIAYHTEVSLNSLLLEGVDRVIADRKQKGVSLT